MSDDVRFWPLADMRWCAVNVRFRVLSGHDVASAFMSNGLGPHQNNPETSPHAEVATQRVDAFVAGLIGQFEHAVSHQAGGWLLISIDGSPLCQEPPHHVTFQDKAGLSHGDSFYFCIHPANLLAFVIFSLGDSGPTIIPT